MIENITKEEVDDGIKYSGEIFFTQIDENIDITYLEEEKELAERCADYVSNMSDEMFAKICKCCIAYYEEVRASLDGEDLEGYAIADMPLKVEEEEIFDYIMDGSLSVDSKNGNVAFALTFECDFEEEHGLECYIKDNELIYVGSFTGTTLYEDTDHLVGQSYNYVR